MIGFGRNKRSSPIKLGDVIEEIKSKGDPHSLSGMRRFGIQTTDAFGVPIPYLRRMSKRIGQNHDLARNLWESGIHEAKLLAGMIDDPLMVQKDQMEDWAADFDSWDIVDQTCGNLFDKTPFAIEKARTWAKMTQEYTKRAGFVLMAELAVHHKREPDKTFLEFLPIIHAEASDERNFVRKAVNWALRQIGKRNKRLNRAAILTAKRIKESDSRTAKWVAADALRELTSESVQGRFNVKKGRVS